MTPQEQAVMDGLVKALRHIRTEYPDDEWILEKALAAHDGLAKEPSPTQERFTHRFLADFAEHKREVDEHLPGCQLGYYLGHGALSGCTCKPSDRTQAARKE